MDAPTALKTLSAIALEYVQVLKGRQATQEALLRQIKDAHDVLRPAVHAGQEANDGDSR